jgi:hypothetical protein
MVASALARRRIRRGRVSDSRLHFWFSFALSVSFLVIRFTWAQRPM